MAGRNAEGVEAAYARCLQMAGAHYENFPVASRLLPRELRPHVAAIYAFARVADDFADEGERTPSERLALLDDWGQRLSAVAKGEVPSGSDDAAAIFVALEDTIRRYSLDTTLFEDLLSAFRQDVTVARYETWEDVLDYCRRSANPVGRIMLRLFHRRNVQFEVWSDAICTALQLTNFWQDLAIDWDRGRLYVPLEILRANHVDLGDLTKRRWSAAWQAAMADVGARTRALFALGRPLPRALAGRLGWQIRATWLGGVRILDRLEAARFDVFHARPTLRWSDALVIAGRTVTWPPKP